MISSSDIRSTDQNYEVSDQSALVEAPLVSVLMLAYNHSAYLAQAIEGVLAQQTEFSIELLIGEDCSTDDTREIALLYQREYPKLIRVITADRNVGLLQNWRRLILSGRGKFLAHLDGDDYWLAGKLAPQIKYLIQHPECAAVYTNAVTVDETGRRLGLFNDVGDAQFDIAAMLRRGNFLNTSSMVFRAALSCTLLELEDLFIDYQVHLRLARHGFLRQLSEPLTVYRMNSIGSMTTKSNDLVRNLYWKAILDVPRYAITNGDLAHGVTDFLRRVVFHAIRTGRWRLILEWVPLIVAASPYGAIRTALLTTASVIRTAANELNGRTHKGPAGQYGKVLHRR